MTTTNKSATGAAPCTNIGFTSGGRGGAVRCGLCFHLHCWRCGFPRVGSECHPECRAHGEQANA